ncbi:hypothetical protein ACFSTC_03485 [Nonomuraea ferruginea]
MRTWFEPEEAEEFEATKDLLIRRCVTWAKEHGHPADDLLLSAAVDARHESRDGSAGVLGPYAHQVLPAAVRAVQGDGFAGGARPRPGGAAHVSALSRRHGPSRPARRHARGGGGDHRRGAGGVRVRARRSHAARVGDVLGAHGSRPGIRSHRPGGAFERFKRELDAGRVPYDQQVLDKIMQNRLVYGGIDEERAFPQPPVSLPPASELAEAAGRSRTVQRLITLADWVGKDGRALTDAGNLRVADALEVSALLGTGEDQLRIRSATDLPQLNLLLAWARKLRLTRTSKGRLLRVAKAVPLLRDPETLWGRAFEVLPELGRVVTVPVATWRPEPILAEIFDEILPDVLNSMYGLDEMPVVRLEETVWLACQEYVVLDEEEHRLDLLRREVARDLGRMFEILSDLGAVELTHGPADPLYASDLDHDDQPLPPDAVERLRAALSESDLPLVRLTPLGVRGVRDRLLAEGRDAPLVGELATAPLGRAARGARPALSTGGRRRGAPGVAGPAGAGRRDVGAGRTGLPVPYAGGGAMLRVLAGALPERRLLQDLRHDPILGPAVWTQLIDAGKMRPGSLSERENLLLGGRRTFCRCWNSRGLRGLSSSSGEWGGGDADEFLEAILASGHPDVVGLRELHELVAEPLRRTARHPLRLVPTRPPGARGRRKKRKR